MGWIGSAGGVRYSREEKTLVSASDIRDKRGQQFYLETVLLALYQYSGATFIQKIKLFKPYNCDLGNNLWTD